MSLSHKSRRKAGLLILAVTGLLAVTPMLSGCGGSGREEALKQAVYVGTGGYDPANDGKSSLSAENWNFWNLLMMRIWASPLRHLM